ncbi:hypothetical protein IPG41_03850 [Candidatus Peregrinibacteria bacterium]|nr:MAG: hypothetical protein IPG41_03850 [Candidatus Peregrinibacteria bacterium]
MPSDTPTILLVAGCVFFAVSVFSFLSIFINLPGVLGSWFGKKNEYKIFFLMNQSKVRGLVELLLIPVPERYHPQGARLVVSILGVLVTYGMIFGWA